MCLNKRENIKLSWIVIQCKVVSLFIISKESY